MGNLEVLDCFFLVGGVVLKAFCLVFMGHGVGSIFFDFFLFLLILRILLIWVRRLGFFGLEFHLVLGEPHVVLLDSFDPGLVAEFDSAEVGDVLRVDLLDDLFAAHAFPELLECFLFLKFSGNLSILH